MSGTAPAVDARPEVCPRCLGRLRRDRDELVCAVHGTQWTPARAWDAVGRLRRQRARVQAVPVTAVEASPEAEEIDPDLWDWALGGEGSSRNVADAARMEARQREALRLSRVRRDWERDGEGALGGLDAGQRELVTRGYRVPGAQDAGPSTPVVREVRKVAEEIEVPDSAALGRSCVAKAVALMREAERIAEAAERAVAERAEEARRMVQIAMFCEATIPLDVTDWLSRGKRSKGKGVPAGERWTCDVCGWQAAGRFPGRHPMKHAAEGQP
jgi:hypothetical protein